MTWITVVFGLACLVAGMACVLLSFIVFKPILTDFYAALATEAKRQIVAAQRGAPRSQAEVEEPRGKSDKHGVVRPKNPNVEDVK